jgi:hypothetical protein
MRIKYLAAIAIFASGAWFAVHSVQSQGMSLRTPVEQPAPQATRVAARLAESVASFLPEAGG